MGRAIPRWVVGLALAAGLAGEAASQAPPPAKPAFTPEQQAKLKNRDDLRKAVNELTRAGKLGEAVAVAEQVLELEKEVLGERSAAVAETYAVIGRCHFAREDWAAARAARQRALDILTAVRGRDDWRVADAREARADVDRAEAMTPADRLDLRRAAGLIREAEQLRRQGKYVAAQGQVSQAADIRRRVLGEDHPEYARTLEELAVLHLYAEEHAKAVPLLKRAAAVLEKALGANHPEYATALGNLAAGYENLGQYAPAESLYKTALSTTRKAHGEENARYALALNGLGEFYHNTGDYARAEPLLRRSLEVRRQALGESAPEFATALNNLALLYLDTGEYDRAEPLFRQVVEIDAKVRGPTHPITLKALSNLGQTYYRLGRFDAAEKLLRRVADLQGTSLGEDHARYAMSLNNLAVVYRETGRHALAEPLYRQALEITGKAQGESHPSYAAALTNLGVLYADMGEYARAEPLITRTLEIRRAALGESHPDFATSLSTLAWLASSAKDPARAEPLFRQALDVRLGLLDRTADVQTEQSQLTFAHTVRGVLDGYLAASAGGKSPAADVYAAVLRWKGQVFVRQRRQRELARAAADPRAAAIAADLLDATRKLAALSGQTPAPDHAGAWRKRVTDLAARRERLEADLTRVSAGFRRERERESLTPDQLRALLPERTALVDFLVYHRLTPNRKAPGGQTREDRLVAFVVRPDRPIARVELGRFDPIREAVEEWRKDTKRRRPVWGDEDPAAILRDKLWLPVAEHLEGVQTVLVSPDRDLARLPFAALPGSDDGKYLIEELAVAVLPVPQFLPDMLAPPAAARTSLLAVGAIDYGADPGTPPAGTPTRAAARGDRGVAWKELPATGEEAAAVARSFAEAHPGGAVKTLRAGEPTEDAVRTLLGKYRWVHLATHGFFAPPSPAGPAPDGRRAVAGVLPGLLSGVVLAGANRPLDPASDADDGVLTAAEIATLDLQGVEAVVLSACETGLGAVAGGEGVFGLQRAFQVAGARTVVASLWQVDDDATGRLMARAYRNWWAGKETKLGGLVEAQRWILREGVPGPDGKPAKGRTPPFYWAAFVLSGDWR